ncbi:MAG: tRNA dihydrouridine synthase DusB [Candidatus Marinimicrobia bacterium]|nr:tRNA dihydrouridine synthase DusB [Candidatus Neomarinimicrobiota bacterium]
MESNLAKLNLKGKVILAPMAGITDSPFRRLCKKYGAGLVYTEMTSSQGIARGSTQTLRYLPYEEEERPIGIQIYGEDTSTMESAAVEVMKWKPDVLDMNFGCPVKKVIKKGAGSALLKDIDHLEEIVRAVVNAVDIPVTAKIRSGWDDKNVNAVEVAQMFEDAGISAISVHPRTREQSFKGKADWSIIKLVKEAVSITVIGNGDINTPESAKRCFEETGCDYVMIGRGAIGRPWIFGTMEHYLRTGELLEEPDHGEKFDILNNYITLEEKFRGEFGALNHLKTTISWFLSGMIDSKKASEDLVRVRTMADFKAKLKEYSEMVLKKENQSSWQLGDIEEMALEG